MSDGPAPTELIRSLAVFSEGSSAEVERLADSLQLPGAPTASDYSDVFLFQLYPYASVYVGAEGMLGGEAASRVSGFWSALGQMPPSEPDHLASLLGLYASLASSTADPQEAEHVLRTEAGWALLFEHLSPWVFGWLERVEEIAGEALGAWARLSFDVLRSEVERSGMAPYVDLPLHLRVTPSLSDPRSEGAADFTRALLSAARTGVIVTRSDLATIARAAGVGLRAGERKYVLEQLLLQDAPGVLHELSMHAGRQRRGHLSRAEWLGAPASELAERADHTARLLAELASEAGFSASLSSAP